MPAYHGPAVLEWQANRSLAFTCEVTASVEENGGGWTVTLTPASVDLTAVDDLLTNPWDLRFPDGCLFEVDLHRSADGAGWLAEGTGLPA